MIKIRKIEKRKFLVILGIGLVVVGGLVLFAFARTWGKTDIEFKIHINKQLVMQSVYGESPTFAIWIEDPETGATKTIFVTNRAGNGDWEGKTDVPVALPEWDQIHKKEQKVEEHSDSPKSGVDGISGATPKPGYFTTRVRVKPGSKWICWIEMNLSGDYNDVYKQYDKVHKTSDDYGSGQPALVYRGEITAVCGNRTVPEVFGMSLLGAENGKIIQPLKGITTALHIFDEIEISVVRPKPRIVNW